MAQPLPYERDYDFEGYQTGHPSTPLPGDKINLELDQVDETIGQILDRIARLQDDDLALKRKSVGYDQLKDELNGFGFEPPTTWATGTAYVERDTVFHDSAFYRCLVSHTAGVFATDLAAGKWDLVADFTEATSAAQTAQAAAEAAQSAAETAQAGAEAAESQAITSAANAATSADSATTLATNASASATAAAGSASDAGASAVAAAASATAAATSEDNAAVSATDAAASASEAAAAAAGVNLPSITETDAGKTLQVKADGSAFELGVIPQDLPSITAADAAKTLQIKADGSGYEVGVIPQDQSDYLDDFVSEATAASALTTPHYALRINVGGELEFLPRTSIILTDGPYSAVADGVTDMGAALNAAIAASNGGTIIVPRGNNFWQVDTPIIHDNQTKVIFEGPSNGSLRANKAAMDVYTMKNTGGLLHNVMIYHMFLPVGVYCPLVLEGVVNADLNRVGVWGGYYGIYGKEGTTASADNVLHNIRAQNGMGPAQIYLNAFSGWWTGRLSSDNAQLVIPTSDNYKGNWAATTSYDNGDIVKVGSYLLQAQNEATGTSGSTAPTPAVYGTDITDGTVTWQLYCHINMASVLIDSDSSFNCFTQVDMAGAFEYGMLINNSVTGDTHRPANIIIDKFNVESVGVAGISNNAGLNVKLYGGTIKGGRRSTSIGVSYAATDGLMSVGNVGIFDWNQAITLSASGKFSAMHNQIEGCDLGLSTGAGVSGFSWIGNDLQEGPFAGVNTTPIKIPAGATDHAIVTHNNCYGSTNPISVGTLTGGGNIIEKNIDYNGTVV